jgi:hypothetical protein
MSNTQVIERLMRGAIDFHVHAAPDPYHERRLDALELARQAKDAGMRAVVIKNHQYGTAPIASLVNKAIPGFSLIGSLTLNREVGGINPEVVRAAARAGALVVWMPTISSVLDAKGKPGISLIDNDKKLRPDVISILEIIRDNNMVLATGHVSRNEIYALIMAAKEIRVKAVITHPLTKGFGYQCTLEEQRELVSLGAFIEHCFVACMPALGGLNPAVMVEHIKAIGADHCILSTDFGQLTNPSPPEGFRTMVAVMLQFGLSEAEVEILVKKNVEGILGLQETSVEG